MIYCCGGYYDPFRTIMLASDFQYKDRKLEILLCPKCGNLVAVLTQFNIQTNKYETFRPKRKKTVDFLNKVKDGSWFELKVNYGTREKAGFVYGENRLHKDGTIYQYAVNFNGEKKLVKIID